MAKNYNDYSYFENRPDIVKIFNDLESFLDFCRIEMHPFDEAHLYNRESWIWRNYEKAQRAKRGDTVRKPYLGNKPRYENRNNEQRFSR